MPPWLSHVTSAQRKQSPNDSSRWVQLATIGIDNTPRVRTVVFRGWSEDYEMEIYTDKRSQKCNELALNDNVEICWFFSKSKCQFRFRGTSRIVLDKENVHHWEKLSEKSKSLWSWPTPGANYLFDKRINNSSNNKIKNPKGNFILLKIDVTHVDQLLLKQPIHERRRWIWNKEWIEERLNP